MVKIKYKQKKERPPILKDVLYKGVALTGLTGYGYRIVLKNYKKKNPSPLEIFDKPDREEHVCSWGKLLAFQDLGLGIAEVLDAWDEAVLEAEEYNRPEDKEFVPTPDFEPGIATGFRMMDELFY